MSVYENLFFKIESLLIVTKGFIKRGEFFDSTVFDSKDGTKSYLISSGYPIHILNVKNPEEFYWVEEFSDIKFFNI